MGGKEAFKSLPPELRAMALAGHYLQSFALMEAGMNTAIGKGLGLNGLQQTIVCKNVGFRDKIHILKTLVEIAPFSPGTKKRHTATLDAAVGYSIDRNMVAHEVFGPDSSGKAIKFLVSKAKGKIQFPDIVWSVDTVEEKSDQLLLARNQFYALSESFGKVDIIQSILNDQAQNGTETIATLLQLGALSPEDLQPLQPPNSSSQKANRAKSQRTRRKPLAKE